LCQIAVSRESNATNAACILAQKISEKQENKQITKHLFNSLPKIIKGQFHYLGIEWQHRKILRHPSAPHPDFPNPGLFPENQKRLKYTTCFHGCYCRFYFLRSEEGKSR